MSRAMAETKRRSEKPWPKSERPNVDLRAEENLVATRLAEYTRFGMVQRRRLRETARRLAATVGIGATRIRSRAHFCCDAKP
jgi:hypothetical protein